MDNKSKFDLDVKWEKSGRIWLPTKWFPLSCLEEAQRFEFRDGDILVSTYPKTGNYITHTCN